MRIFTLNADDAGQRLDKYIMKITDMPRSLVYKYIRTGHIKVNKKKKDGSFFLSAGDAVSRFLSAMSSSNRQKAHFLKKSLT